MTKYEEIQINRQKEFNQIDFIFAFSNEQFAEELEKRGITTKDLCRANSLIMPKTEFPKYKKYLESEPNWFKLMCDPEFAYEAFRYEMYNHEYPINWQGDWDVCECFNFSGKELEYVEGKSGIEYLHELGYPNATLSAYRKAAREVRESQEW